MPTYLLVALATLQLLLASLCLSSPAAMRRVARMCWEPARTHCPEGQQVEGSLTFLSVQGCSEMELVKLFHEHCW